jgi:hypothetical protein
MHDGRALYLSALVLQLVHSRPFADIFFRVKKKRCFSGRAVPLNDADAADIVSKLPGCRRNELLCLANWNDMSSPSKRCDPYNAGVCVGNLMRDAPRTMDPYPSSFVDGSLAAVSKIRRAARAEFERRPSAPEAAQADLDALPWALPGGKMDIVEQGRGGPALCGWAATAERELIEEVGRGGAARLTKAQARRVATQVVEARAGWLVPLLVVAVEGGAAADSVFIPNGEFRTARWVPLAQVRAACAGGSSGDVTLLEDDEWLALFKARAAGPEVGPAFSAGSASAHSAQAPVTDTATAIAGWAFEDGCEEKDREWWAAAVSRTPPLSAAAASVS